MRGDILRDSDEISSALLDRIYDAAMDPHLWDSAIQQIATLTHSSGGILMGQSGLHEALYFTHHTNVSEESIRQLGSRHVLNPWTQYMWTTSPVGVAVPTDRILPAADLRRTAFFDEVLRPSDVSHSLMIGLTQKTEFGVGVSLNRPFRQGPYGETEQRLLTALAPHLRRSVQLGFRVDAYKALQHQAYESLDRLAIGVVLLDRRGKIVFANAAALALDDARGPLRLGRRSVSHTSSLHTRRIEALVQKSLQGAPMAAISVPRSDDSYPLTILATPMRSRDVDRLAAASLKDAAVLLFIVDPASKAGVSPLLLMEAHGLTHAEANVAIAVSTHGTIPDTARALGVSPNTVKTHLRNVFSKLGIGHQAELARLIGLLRVVNQPAPAASAAVRR